ncbi:MAG TPA: ribonuclease HII [Lachnospiraceae bacterium]|nr:ribonuclease HII [Lachnospiraceae bacterium]
MKTIFEIKEELKATKIEELLSFVEKYSADERSGVTKLVETANKKHVKYLMEKERMNRISSYERKYISMGYKNIGGIDEVGRGPLAGPVVTACVILPNGCIIEGVDDSKRLSAEKREELCEVIKREAVDIGVGVADNEEIDKINILRATKLAMKRAIEAMKTKPDMLLIDALTLDEVDIPQEAIIKGDSKSISIAAASIVAKVTRDKMMKELAEKYSVYGFETNVGYGTAEHIEAIKKHGPCDIHRRTFISRFV